MNASDLIWWSVNIGLSNGLVPSGKKSMLTQIYFAIWHHQATMS